MDFLPHQNNVPELKHHIPLTITTGTCVLNQGRLNACLNNSVKRMANGKLPTVWVKLSYRKSMVSLVFDKNFATSIFTTSSVVEPAVTVYGLVIKGSVLKSVSAPG